MISSLKKPVALLSALLLAIMITAPALAVAPAPGAFQRTWERTDKPVADGDIARTWIWGPDANTEVLQEPYAESPGGERDVQYFDKSRMEINHPDAVDDGLWFVTNGLLVVELMTGNMQVGDFSFEQRSPAEINIVGDPGFAETPTYADYAGLRDTPAFAADSLITVTIDGDGNVGNNGELGEWNVTADELAPITGHRTASVFWDFMNSSGLVYEDGALVNDLLFENPYYATGYPITEAYWSRVMLAGSEQWVLTQAFERRVLTYAPNNNEGFQVEAGNVGLHYYEWRYETGATGTATVTTFDNDGTTVQGGVLVEAFSLEAGETCADVAFETDVPAATGTTDATTGVYAFTDLAAGDYCVGADFDGDLTTDDATAVATVTAGGSVSVSLSDPNASTQLTVTVFGDDDLPVANADVELFAGTCATVAVGATPVATGATNASGAAVLDVDDLAAGSYCLIASNASGVIGEVDVTLPDDSAVTIGGTVGVTITTTVGGNEVQTISATGADGGTFTLTFDGQETDPLPFDATAAQIEDELEELSNIEPGDVVVTGGPVDTDDVVIEFTGVFEFTNVSEITADGSGLAGGTITVTTTTAGEAGVSEVQLLVATDATGGTFTLSFDGEATAPIAYNATAATIETALEGVLDINPGDVSASGGPINSANVTINFTGDLAATDVPQITSNNAGLTGETVGVTVDTTTDGEDSVNEVQTLAATGVTGGTFTLSLGAEETGPIPFNASAAVIEDELEELPSLDPGDVDVNGGPINSADVTIEFTGNYAAMDVAEITVDDLLLVGTTVVVTTTNQGAAPVIQVLTVGSAVTGGTFTLTYDGATTAAIAFDATATQVEAALEALSTIGNVTVTGDLSAGASSTITFVDPSPPESLIVVDDSLIT